MTRRLRRQPLSITWWGLPPNRRTEPICRKRNYGPGGKIIIGVKVGGLLGFGGRTVAIPDDKFNHIGDIVQVDMTANEVNKLPKAGQK